MNIRITGHARGLGRSLYEHFKTKTVNSPMNLQKLVNRSIHQYLYDASVRESIETYDKLHTSGSQF